jgi:hypothetical protein
MKTIEHVKTTRFKMKLKGKITLTDQTIIYYEILNSGYKQWGGTKEDMVITQPLLEHMHAEFLTKT